MNRDFETRVERFASTTRKFLKELEEREFDYNEKWSYNWLRSEISETNIRFAVEYEVASDYYVPLGNIFLITSGTGLTTGITAFMWTYLSLAEKITVSVSRRDKWLHGFLDLLDDDSIRIVTNPTSHEAQEIIEESDVLVVYGNSNTCNAYKAVWDSNSTINKSAIYYGSKVSIGIHDTTFQEYDDVERYFNDIVIHDGLGCLNTNTLYVKDKDSTFDFFEQIAKKKREYYKGKEKEGFFSYRHKCINERPPIAKGYGDLYIVEYGDDLELVAREWKNSKNLLSSCTYAGDRLNEWLPILSSIGISRITEPGRAQYPELTWNHDGKRNLLPLVKLMGSEI